MKNELKGLHIEGRRWFQRTCGNTYHTVYIYANGKSLVAIERTYGYGDQYLQTALDWLRANGHIPDVCERCKVGRAAHKPDSQSGHFYSPPYGTRYVREELGGTYSVIDVTRKGDL